jgi:hypothetical protein
MGKINKYKNKILMLIQLQNLSELEQIIISLILELCFFSLISKSIKKKQMDKAKISALITNIAVLKNGC